MATTWPTRGQKAPNYWDEQLKAYIDEADTDLLAQFENQVPGVEKLYAEKTTPFSITAVNTPQAIPGLVGTVTGAGRACDIEIYLPKITHSVANTSQMFGVNYSKNGTYAGYLCLGYAQTPLTSSTYYGFTGYAKGRLVLTEGDTYQFSGLLLMSAAGTGTIGMDANNRGFLAVTSR